MNDCSHTNIDWEPADVEYGARRLAVVVQRGFCRDCGRRVEVGTDLEDATVVPTEE